MGRNIEISGTTDKLLWVKRWCRDVWKNGIISRVQTFLENIFWNLQNLMKTGNFGPTVKATSTPHIWLRDNSWEVHALDSIPERRMFFFSRNNVCISRFLSFEYADTFEMLVKNPQRVSPKTKNIRLLEIQCKTRIILRKIDLFH